MSEQNQISVIVCGSAWGVGTFDTGDPEWGVQYGIPTADIDPHDFDPDRESCLPKEIAAWEEAKANCKCGKGHAVTDADTYFGPDDGQHRKKK